MKYDFYKKILDESLVGYAYHRIICDKSGNPCDYEFIYVNKEFEELTGINGNKLKGKKFTEIFSKNSPYEISNIKLFGEIALNRGKKEFKQYSKYCKRWFRVTVYSPEKFYFVTIISTERKQIEEELKQSEQKYRLIFEHTPLGVVHFNNKGIITDCNESFIKILGSTRNDIIGLDMLLLPDKNVTESLFCALRGKVATYQGNYKSVTGNKLSTIKIIFAPIHNNDGIVKGGVCIVEDITESKRLESALFNEKKLLETTLRSVADGVISTNCDGKIVFLNKAAECLTGWNHQDAKERYFEEVFYTINESTNKKNINIVEKALQSGKTEELSNNTLLISKDGKQSYIESSASPISEESEKIIGVVLVFRDYSEKRQKQKKIEYLSFHDQLTGLYNRRFYVEQLKYLDTKRNYPLAIAMGDVNGLKLINDSFGHVMGDLLLDKVAGVLRTVCREDDIIARLDGDEFVIIMPKTDEPEARIILNNIKKLASKEMVGSICVSIPFGYEIKYSEDEKIEEIFKKAENHMYKKKLSESPSVRGNTISAIISALYEKNRREEQHSHRVSELCKKMGIALDMNEYKVEELKTVGLLHDIGKIAIDDNILNKPGKLNNEEWIEIRRHPEIGYRILNTVNDMSDIASYVLFHHERWDGNGYPKHIKENEIPMASRIIAIADTYDAMTSDRSYRNALPEYIALQELKKNAGIQFDPELVNVFIKKVLKIS